MSTNWQIGDKIENRWEINHILRGGMGIVYIVYDHELHSSNAAKTYQDKIFACRLKIAERFQQEALAWVNLDIHQNVTRANFVETIHGKPYLFLEYVSGGDLSGWIGAPRLTKDLPQVLRFAIHICDGMTHALSKGIKAHRDIKPQNCLITKNRTLKVTDFGLVKVFDDIATGPEVEKISDVQVLNFHQTQTGTGAGTAPYMAPEQFDVFKHVDVSADIYAFGVMLYEMVTGRLPFQAVTLKDYIKMHKEQLPATAHIKPKSLREIIETCLIKDPSRRFGDFTMLQRELADIYEKATQKPALPPVGGIELDAMQLNNKGVSLTSLGRDDEALACYERALELNPRLEQAWSNKGVALAGLGRTEEALYCYDQALKLNPRFEEAWYGKGATLFELGRYGEALECFDRALELNPQDWKALTEKGLALANSGRYDEALACYDRAFELNPKDDKTWYNKGVTSANFGRYDEALACFDCACKLNPRNEQAWFNKGASLFNLGRYEEALSCFEESQRLEHPRASKAITKLRLEYLIKKRI